MPDLDTGDATELAELLQFLNDWLAGGGGDDGGGLVRFTGRWQDGGQDSGGGDHLRPQGSRRGLAVRGPS